MCPGGHALPDEDTGLWDTHRDALYQHFAPLGPIEEQFVERIAVCAWRLTRATRIETSVFSYQALDRRARDARRTASSFERPSPLLLTEQRREVLTTTITEPAQHAAALARATEAESARDQEPLAAAFMTDGQPLAKLSRYETALERSLFRGPPRTPMPAGRPEEPEGERPPRFSMWRRPPIRDSANCAGNAGKSKMRNEPNGASARWANRRGSCENPTACGIGQIALDVAKTLKLHYRLPLGRTPYPVRHRAERRRLTSMRHGLRQTVLGWASVVCCGFLVPLSSPAGWEVLSFSRIPPNRATFQRQGLRIDVDRSAGPLSIHCPSPRS